MPKRYGNLYNSICSIENITQAAIKSLVKHAYKKDTAKKFSNEQLDFIEHKDERIKEIQHILLTESYVPAPLHKFTVYEPKVREIACPQFYPDKIIDHALMLVLKPIFYEKFTKDTYNCIEGRGITTVVKYMKKFIKCHPDWYFVQTDIHHYYQSINHDILKQQIRRVIKCKRTLKLIDTIIDSHSEGLPIGRWPSQLEANYHLTPLDHKIKEVYHLPYVRFMDDMIFFCETKEAAHNMVSIINKEVADLNLKLKDNVRIAPISYGIDFVGYKFYPTHVALRKSIKLRMIARCKELDKAGVCDAYYKQQMASYWGWCKWGDCKHLVNKYFRPSVLMEFKRLNEIKSASFGFSLPKGSRVSIMTLINKDIIFYEYKKAKIKNEDKLIVKFAYENEPENYKWFITTSKIIEDRLDTNKEQLPFIAKVVQKYGKQNYLAIE